MDESNAELNLKALAEQANQGSREALGRLIEAVRDDVYGIALRMVWNPADAEDATQEILIKVITRLGTFRGEASVRTWVFRVAVNHLIDRGKSRLEQQRVTFEGLAEDLADGLAEPDGPLDAFLVEEVKLGCTLAMLSCLDRDHRVAYVLGEVFDVSSSHGAYITDVTANVYRKRLSRARARVRHFMSMHCGLVAPHATSCRCERRVKTAVEKGRVNPADLVFARHPRRSLAAAGTREMEGLHAAAAVMRSHPAYAVPEKVTASIRSMLDSGRLCILFPNNEQ